MPERASMAMRLILNENIPRIVVEALRAGGHDVLSVKEMMRGASDAAIVQRANDERRLVVTQDKDFGELAFRQGMRAVSGVILFRLTGSSPDADLRRMVSVIEGRTAWEGIFAVATDSRLRLRFHPPKPPNGN
jgi:predicted nuclease of predicted toxin-antitoxin system